MATTALTAKQTALLAALGDWQGSFLDAGCVPGADIWADVLTHEAPATVSATPRGVATVANSLVKLGYLAAGKDGSDAFYVLTEMGAAEARRLAAEARAAAATEEAAPTEEAPVIPAAEEPGDEEVRVSLAGQKILYEELEGGEVTIDVARGIGLADPRAAHPSRAGSPAVISVEDNYRVVCWTDETPEYGPVEWTEVQYQDGSRSLRRRRKVSGAWRTDFWGQEAGSEKLAFTTSRSVSEARGRGSFRHGSHSL